MTAVFCVTWVEHVQYKPSFSHEILYSFMVSVGDSLNHLVSTEKKITEDQSKEQQSSVFLSWTMLYSQTSLPTLVETLHGLIYNVY